MFVDDSDTIKRTIISSLLLVSCIYFPSLKRIFTIEFYLKDEYIVLFKFIQFFSFIYLFISFIFFLAHNRLNTTENDNNIVSGFFMFNLSVIFMCKWYNHSFKKEAIVPIVIYEIKSFINNLKGKIESINRKDVDLYLEECSICLDTEFESKLNKNDKYISDECKEKVKTIEDDIIISINQHSIDEIEENNSIEEKKISEDLSTKKESLLNSIESIEKVDIIILDCSHKYHYKCLNKCFINKLNKCPLCRVPYIIM